jgi:hypothetical protein
MDRSVTSTFFASTCRPDPPPPSRRVRGRREYFEDGLTELAPEISPDGAWLAFARRIPGERTRYRTHEMAQRTAQHAEDLARRQGGVIYDGNPLNELWPQRREAPGLPLATDAIYRPDPQSVGDEPNQ